MAMVYFNSVWKLDDCVGVFDVTKSIESSAGVARVHLESKCRNFLEKWFMTC